MNIAVIPNNYPVYLTSAALRIILSPRVVLLCDRAPPTCVNSLAEVLLVERTDRQISIRRYDSDGENATICWERLAFRVVATTLLWISDEHTLKRLATAFAEGTMNSLGPVSIAEDDTNFLLQSLASAYQSKYESAAKSSLAAHMESYAIRRELENSKSAQFELQEIARKSGCLIPWLSQVAELCSESIELISDQTIDQILPFPSKGFAGFDLHFEWASPNAELELRADLHIADSGELVASWTKHLFGIGGWLHFRLERALEERGAAMLIRLAVIGPPPSSASSSSLPRLSLSNIERQLELSVNIDKKSKTGSALAFRVWQGPPGLILPVENSPTHALRSNKDPGAIVVPLNWQLPNARPIGAVAEYNSKYPGAVGVIDGAFQLHVVAREVSVARIERGLDDSLVEVMSEVRVHNSLGPYVEFLVGLASPEMTDSELVLNLEANLIRHSGWHVAGPATTNLVTVERPATLTGVGDIVLATRTRSNGSADYGWARFQNLRASWHPQRARPVSFDISPGAEPLYRLRRDLIERRRVHSAGFKNREISVLCPIHRPGDMPNLLRQLSKLWAPNVEILVATNGSDISKSDTVRLQSALPTATVWHDSGKTLAAVLNNCIERASGEVLAKIDADDYYGENYLTDLAMEMAISGAEVVGKSEFGVLFSDEDRLAIHRGLPHSQFVPQVAGGTLMFSLETARSIGFDESLAAAEDLAFQKEVLKRGGAIWSGDIFNYVHVRRSDTRRHTWAGSYNDYRCWPVYRDYGADNIWMLFA